MKIRLIKSWEYWIWDPSLQENTNWQLCNFQITEFKHVNFIFFHSGHPRRSQFRFPPLHQSMPWGGLVTKSHESMIDFQFQLLLEFCKLDSLATNIENVKDAQRLRNMLGDSLQLHFNMPWCWCEARASLQAVPANAHWPGWSISRAPHCEHVSNKCSKYIYNMCLRNLGECIVHHNLNQNWPRTS